MRKVNHNSLLMKLFDDNGVERALQILSNNNIIMKKHSKYPNLTLFKYHHINTTMNKIACDCRGIIVDMDTMEIVARPFDKFWNYGQPKAAKVNLKTAKAYEKVDGSLCFIYYYDKQWHVSTSGVPDASGMANNGLGAAEVSFNDLFWETWDQLGYVNPDELNKSVTYIFELCTEYNRVVCRYDERSLNLLAARTTKTGQYLDLYNVSFNYGFDTPKVYEFSSIDDLIDSVNKRSPDKHEGVILVDANNNRVKIKSDGYCALHHSKDKSSVKHIVKHVIPYLFSTDNVGDDFLMSYPEYKTVFNFVKQHMESLLKQSLDIYENISHVKSDRDFAQKAMDAPINGLLFALRYKKATDANDYLKDKSSRSILNMFEIKKALNSLNESNNLC